VPAEKCRGGALGSSSDGEEFEEDAPRKVPSTGILAAGRERYSGNYRETKEREAIRGSAVAYREGGRDHAGARATRSTLEA